LLSFSLAYILLILRHLDEFKGTLEKAFEDIRKLAVESGAPEDLELIQVRDKDKIILFGMPGTLERLKSGDFPPPPREYFPPPPRDQEDQGDDNRPRQQQRSDRLS
jgi:hypothetical protein